MCTMHQTRCPRCGVITSSRPQLCLTQAYRCYSASSIYEKMHGDFATHCSDFSGPELADDAQPCPQCRAVKIECNESGAAESASSNGGSTSSAGG